MQLRLAFFLSLIFAFAIFFTKVNFAKEADFGIAQYLPIEDKKVRPGDIVSSTNQGFFLAIKAYDQKMVGVVSDKPAISFDIFQTGSNIKRYQVVSAGTAAVNVSTLNGPIKKGDLVTSSSLPGVGMKATKTGFVLGSALEESKSTDAKEIRKINVVLNLRTASAQTTVKTHLIDLGNLSALALLEDPLEAFRYILAALVVLAAVVFGFYAFGRVASRGVEAIGRNPLAARTIQFGVVMNVFITIAIIGVGIVVAILILTL